MTSLLVLLFLATIVISLLIIAVRSGRTPQVRGFARTCPHCHQDMPARATVCFSCSRSSEPVSSSVIRAKMHTNMLIQAIVMLAILFAAAKFFG